MSVTFQRCLGADEAVFSLVVPIGAGRSTSLLFSFPKGLGLKAREAKCHTQEISCCVHYKQGKVLWRGTTGWVLSLPEKVANACCGLSLNFGGPVQ